MLQPAIWYIGNEIAESGISIPVRMNFAGCPKKHLVLSKVEDSTANRLFAPTLKNKPDASALMDMLGKDQPGPMPTGEDANSRNSLNATNSSVASGIKES